MTHRRGTDVGNARSLRVRRLGAPRRRTGPGHTGAGFTLLEVLFALTLFFVAVFAILDVVNQGLRAARSLQMNVPDIGPLAADLILTNRLEPGVESGDFGELYPDFAWSREISPEGTNGLFRITFVIEGALAGRPISTTSELLLWRPESLRVVPGLRR